MKDFSKIAELMRSDWNRRVAHDYRFWMSDGREDDGAMWASGERDFALITRDIQNTHELSIMELGCGVGRLLRSASEKFKHVIGLDVSEAAIEKARGFLAGEANCQLKLGNGYDLEGIGSSTLDVVFSYAALTSIPTEIISNYLREIHRVLKPRGIFRLQCYLGSPQVVRRTDTLHLRCYERANFQAAVEAAGFELEYVEDLVLPIQVSFKEIGIEAVVVSLRRADRLPSSAEEIAGFLLPNGELPDQADAPDDALEYWMAINYAKDLADSGDMDRAREALEYAVACTKTVTTDVRDLFDRIEKAALGQAAVPAPASSTAYHAEVLESDNVVFERNMTALKARFPEIWSRMNSYSDSGEAVEIRDSAEGKTIWSDNQCLDHAQKPKSGADAWVKRSLNEARIKGAESIIIYGFGGGYHLEAFKVQRPAVKISCVEPSTAAFRRAIEARDLVKVINSLESLSIGQESIPEFFDEDSEFLARPQTQALTGSFYAQTRAKFYGTRGLRSLTPKIAAVGPIQGGTLPILGYTARSLVELKQRVRVLDMSGYANGFHLVEDFVQDDVRRAIQRNNYVEMTSQLIFESFTEKPADLLIMMAQAPISARILQELRKQGVVTALWFTEDYLRFTYWQLLAPYYDFVFTIQKGDCVDKIKAAGAGEVMYLPMACDPGIHRPLNLSEEERARWGSPISFVGAGYHNRQQTFASLSNLPFKIWGTEWPECKPFDRMVQEGGRRLTPEEYVKIFNATDININLHSSSERDGVDPSGDFVNPRTFELAACGAFQLVDERSHLPELFIPGKEVITFRSTEDLKEKIKYFLEHPEERREIAARARERVLKDHTYDKRIKEMLSTIYSSKFEHLRARSGRSTWKKMLDRSQKHEELNKRCKAAFVRGDEPILDALVSDITTGKGNLTPTEQKLLFLFHVRKQIIRMTKEEQGHNK